MLHLSKTFPRQLSSLTCISGDTKPHNFKHRSEPLIEHSPRLLHAGQTSKGTALHANKYKEERRESIEQLPTRRKFPTSCRDFLYSIERKRSPNDHSCFLQLDQQELIPNTSYTLLCQGIHQQQFISSWQKFSSNLQGHLWDDLVQDRFLNQSIAAHPIPLCLFKVNWIIELAIQNFLKVCHFAQHTVLLLAQFLKLLGVLFFQSF